jgi:hypothetical protein
MESIMHTEPRNGASIDRIYLHTNEGPQAPLGAARNLRDYLQSIDGGYHVIVDQAETVYCAGDDIVVWAEGGDNTHALSICMIGRASQNWNTIYSQAEIERAAKVVAHWCVAYNIPVVHVRPGAPGQAPTDRGIAEHADDHAPSSAGHTDPGAGFPIDAFVARVREIIELPAKLAALAAWAKRVSTTPLQFGETSEDVTIAKQLLAHAGYDVGNTEPLYGLSFVAKVHAYKLAKQLPNLDGRELGANVVKALGL